MKLAEVVAPKQESAPPELDWSYQQTTGILICRIVSVASRKRKKGEGEYLTISVNGKVGGKNPEILTYFHSTHREALKAATGKIAKLETEVKGDFANVLAVLEIDGEKVAPHVDPVDSHESKARLLASALEFTDEELKELHTRWCKGSWEEVLQKLEDEKVRRATMEGDPA